jgi:hypothetical protein
MRHYRKLILFLLLFFTAFSIFCDEKLINTEDRNKDGKPDRWTYLKPDGGFIIKSDNNHDGIIDYILETDKAGNKIYEAMDFNYDGEMDNFYYYQNGVFVRQEIDSNFDGNIDIWIYNEKGMYITKIERDKDHDGVIDYVKKYK